MVHATATSASSVLHEQGAQKRIWIGSRAQLDALRTKGTQSRDMCAPTHGRAGQEHARAVRTAKQQIAQDPRDVNRQKGGSAMTNNVFYRWMYRMMEAELKSTDGDRKNRHQSYPAALMVTTLRSCNGHCLEIVSENCRGITSAPSRLCRSKPCCCWPFWACT